MAEFTWTVISIRFPKRYDVYGMSLRVQRLQIYFVVWPIAIVVAQQNAFYSSTYTFFVPVVICMQTYILSRQALVSQVIITLLALMGPWYVRG